LSFGSPQLLLLLLLVPVVVVLYLALDRYRAKRASRWSTQPMVPNVVRRPAGVLRYLPVALLLIGLSLALVGVARPVRHVTRHVADPPTVMLAFDVSGSMAAKDVRPSRLAAARTTAMAFVNQLPTSYRIGLLTFDNAVHVLVPPTLNRQQVLTSIPRVITPKSGTSIGDAVSAALAIVLQVTNASQTIASRYAPGAIAVFSDGAQTAGGADPKLVALTAQAHGIPIDSIVVGTPKGSVTQRLKVDGFDTSVTFPVPVEPGALVQVSQQTNGTSAELTDSVQAPTVGKTMTGALARLRPNDLPPSSFGVQHLTLLTGALAVCSIVAGVVLSGLWFGRLA